MLPAVPAIHPSQAARRAERAEPASARNGARQTSGSPGTSYPGVPSTYERTNSAPVRKSAAGPRRFNGSAPAFPFEDPAIKRQFLPAHPARRHAAALVVVPREVENPVEDEEENARLRRLLPSPGLRKAGGRGNDDVPRHARAAHRDAVRLREGKDVRGAVPAEIFPVPARERRVPDHPHPHVGPVRRKESQRSAGIRLQPPPRKGSWMKILAKTNPVSFMGRGHNFLAFRVRQGMPPPGRYVP